MSNVKETYDYILSECEPLVSSDTYNDIVEKLEELEQVKEIQESTKNIIEERLDNLFKSGAVGKDEEMLVYDKNYLSKEIENIKELINNQN